MNIRLIRAQAMWQLRKRKWTMRSLKTGIQSSNASRRTQTAIPIGHDSVTEFSTFWIRIPAIQCIRWRRRRSNDSRWSNQTGWIYQREWRRQIWIPVLKHWRTCIRHQWHEENAWTCSWWTWKAWIRHTGKTRVQRRLFLILKSKKKYTEWHFCHHMYFPSLKLFEVL